MHISFEYFPLRALTANSSVAGFGGSGRCRRARPSNSDNQQQKQPLAQHSPGARERCTLALSHTSMCAVCFENWCFYVCSFLFRPLERWQCPSSCSPALTVFRSCPSSFCRTSTGHSFSHQSLLQEKTNFFLKLFRNCLNTVTAFCLKANFCVLTKRHVLYTLHFA